MRRRGIAGAVDSYVNCHRGSAAMRYHAQEKKVRVKSMELTDSNTKNGTQTVKVVASVDGQESPVSILFTYGENGKIRYVTYQ